MRYNTEDLSKRIEKKKKRKKLINNIIYIILIFFFIINIIILIQNTTNPKKIPNLFGFKTFSIVSRKYGTYNYGKRFNNNKELQTRRN